MEDKKRESFVFYRSYFEAIELIPDNEHKAKAYKTICDYALNGKITKNDSYIELIFKQAKPQIDKSNLRYDNCKKNGKLGAEKKKQKHSKLNQENNQRLYQDANQGLNQDTNQRTNQKPNQGNNQERNQEANLNYNYNVNYNDNYNYNDNQTNKIDGRSVGVFEYLKILYEKLENVYNNKELSLPLDNSYFERLKSFFLKLSFEKSVKVGNMELSVENVMQDLVSIFARSDSEAVELIYECFNILDESKPKNKFNYLLSVFYNKVKGF